MEENSTINDLSVRIDKIEKELDDQLELNKMLSTRIVKNTEAIRNKDYSINSIVVELNRIQRQLNTFVTIYNAMKIATFIVLLIALIYCAGYVAYHTQ
jgi:hypothetical protein